MRSHWLVSGSIGALSALVMTAPARAATLQTWWFDSQRNQLVFNTDAGVQPQAQMLFNPTRIVVDLPNTSLGSVSTGQQIGGAVKAVRAGQFDPQTTRLVIELDAGYQIDPQQVSVQGISSQQWVVQLPDPALGSIAAPGTESSIPQPALAQTSNQIQGQRAQATATLTGVVATGDGFLIKLNGRTPDPQVEVTGDGPDDRQVQITLPDTGIAPDLQASALPNYRYSIISWNLDEQPGNPPQTVITLQLGPDSPDWRALKNSSGVILLPPVGVSISSVPDQPQPSASGTTSPSTTASQPAAPPPSQPAAPPVATPPPRPAPPETLPSAPNGRLVVVLDPGHGGRDPGAVGINNLQEKLVIFPISMRVAQLLEQQGVTVVMTRSDDRTVDLQARVDIAERARANVFVSIHANSISLSRPDVNGIESYYASDTGRQLAASLQASMLAATGMHDRGVKQARFYVIRRTSMPAALVEVGFVTGAQDYPKLVDAAWRETMANAIARGILQYLQQHH